MSKVSVSISDGTLHIENVYDGVLALTFNTSDDGGIEGKNIFIGEVTHGMAMLIGKALAEMILDCDSMFNDELASAMFQMGFYGNMYEGMKE